ERRLSAADCRLSARGCRLPIVECRLAARGSRLSAVGRRLSPLPTVAPPHCRPSPPPISLQVNFNLRNSLPSQSAAQFFQIARKITSNAPVMPAVSQIFFEKSPIFHFFLDFGSRIRYTSSRFSPNTEKNRR
ncbi:MAG: hypothetical protein IJ678_06470, partial [Kiritimatiellae bacterium]|nr:hypothetical protein [Kiritimatiellia bacterium]